MSNAVRRKISGKVQGGIGTMNISAYEILLAEYTWDEIFDLTGIDPAAALQFLIDEGFMTLDDVPMPVDAQFASFED